jgi:predicted Rossmann fold flavoprotein
MPKAQHIDVIILGAGAAGMMCAIEAGRRGHKVLVLDHAKAPGEKIRISGGGRCNFTNIHSSAANFLSANPHFAKSALAAFTPQDFIDRVKAHGIAFHEKTLGQLFCDGSAREIIAMLTDDMREAGVDMRLATTISAVTKTGPQFEVITSAGDFTAANLVVATGGKSIPKMGATGFGYDLAKQFGHAIVETRPALVPFTWPDQMAETWAQLSGVALPVRTMCGGASFDEAMLFTHRGLSGPALLQVSSYWREGEGVAINLLPERDAFAALTSARSNNAKVAPLTALSELLPRRLAELLCGGPDLSGKRLADLGNAALQKLAQSINQFSLIPGGTEGYRTAEVTLGGVDTSGLNQKTMESKLVPGLYFIGEVVDVTGHLGGHNFQWAWASGAAAGRNAWLT